MFFLRAGVGPGIDAFFCDPDGLQQDSLPVAAESALAFLQRAAVRGTGPVPAVGPAGVRLAHGSDILPYHQPFRVQGRGGGEAALGNHTHRSTTKFKIIAGTGSNDTPYTVELCKDALSCGADALLMVTPYYNKTSQKGLISHYFYVADKVDAPIILYNVPSRTGVNIMPETYAKLCEHPNIVATKEANGDISSVALTKSLCGDKLDIYSGNDDQIVPIMSLGGIGVISVLSNIAPFETHKICADYLEGNCLSASQKQIFYAPLIKALFSDVNPIPVKEAMNIMGMNVGPCRLPLVEMDELPKQKLIEELKNCKLI